VSTASLLIWERREQEPATFGIGIPFQYDARVCEFCKLRTTALQSLPNDLIGIADVRQKQSRGVTGLQPSVHGALVCLDCWNDRCSGRYIIKERA